LGGGSGETIRLSRFECDRYQHLSESLVRRFTAEDYSLSEFEALAVMQHYGLPTVMIDCTSNSGTSMKFAIGGSYSENVGRICVIPVTSYSKGLSVVELGEHAWALRAQRQDGFAVLRLGREQAVDLKSTEARDRWGVLWFEFDIAPADREQTADKYSQLTSIRDDPTAGILRHEIIEYAEKYGKFAPRLAQWLVRRSIPMVPRAYRVLSNSEGLVEHVAAAQVWECDEEREREQTEKYLSQAYPDDSRDRLHEERLENGKILVDPRTWHPDRYHVRTMAS
jgi:hypothetical protein